MGITIFKEKQFERIQQHYQPKESWQPKVTSAEQILTAEEALLEADAMMDFEYPDFTMMDASKALMSGKITVYSTQPISNGTFVSTSKMFMSSYAGANEVTERQVALEDISWLSTNTGILTRMKGE